MSVLHKIVDNYICEVWCSLHPKRTLWKSAECTLKATWMALSARRRPTNVPTKYVSVQGW